MTTTELINQIRIKKSFLAVGLDVDLTKIPPHLLALEDPIFEFNKAIIDATHDLTVAYKPNTAFYEAYGTKILVSAGVNTAILAAQSIPYFKEGGEMERDGMAMVGDGYKKEYVVTPRGQVYITPDIPTVVNMEKGSTIYPDASSFMNEYINKMYVDTSKIENKLDKIVYAINSQKQPEKKDRLIDYMKYHRMYGRDAKGN